MITSDARMSGIPPRLARSCVQICRVTPARCAASAPLGLQNRRHDGNCWPPLLRGDGESDPGLARFRLPPAAGRRVRLPAHSSSGATNRVAAGARTKAAAAHFCLARARCAPRRLPTRCRSSGTPPPLRLPEFPKRTQRRFAATARSTSSSRSERSEQLSGTLVQRCLHVAIGGGIGQRGEDRMAEHSRRKREVADRARGESCATACRGLGREASQRANWSGVEPRRQ